MTPYLLSPSDLTFLWEGCKRCFYLKVKHKIQYAGAFPGIFSKMANLTSQFYAGKPSEEISPTLPPGYLMYKENWVRSAPIAIPGSAAECVIRGRFDAVIAFTDGTYGVVDYKTSESTNEKAAFYSRQLSAYAYALENPAPKALHLAPVTRLGLFVITPARFERSPAGEMVFANTTTWVEIPRHDAAFLSLLAEVVAVLEAPEPPPPAETCGMCQYLEKRRAF
ncbi:MAG: PD-(D/E)XK nuclease family protein [Anaerolineales bacterium]|nr:PD-(D/E)XK nuclease family protein [Anaerolineales bacterium]